MSFALYKKKSLKISPGVTYISAMHSLIVLNTVVMPCDLGQSWDNIYGSSVGWLENKRMST